jgi:hypothetical protein
MKDRQAVADEILKRILGVETPQIIEIGIEVGKLSATLLGRRPELVLFMVDNWAPRERQPVGYVDTGDPSAMKTGDEQQEREAQARAVALEYPGRAFIVKDDSVHAAQRFKNCVFDLVFIDGDHSFEGVLADLSAWRLKVRIGGWIGGHDYGNPTSDQDMSGVKSAVDSYFTGMMPETGRDWTWFLKRVERW